MLPKKLSAFLWYFSRPYLNTFVGMIFAVLFYGIFSSINPYLLKIIIDVINQPYDSAEALLAAVWVPAILFVLVYQATDFSWALQDYFRLRTIPKVRADILNKTFEYIQGHSYGYFQKSLMGSISVKVSDLARSAESIISQAIEPLCSQVLVWLIAIFSMCLVNPIFGGVLCAWSFLFLGISYIFYKKTLVFSALYSESHTVCVGKLVDSITNVINTKLFARQKYETTYLAKYIDNAREHEQTLQKFLFKVKLWQGTSVTLLFGFMLGALIYARLHQRVTVGDFAFVLTLSMSVMQGLWYLSSHFLMFSQELGICQQALSIMNVPHDVKDKDHATTLKVTQGEIIFDKVGFQYDRGKTVFKDKSLVIKGGQKVGLVGSSGSGKTTFASLILRFFDVTTGKILIDKQNIADVTQDSLHTAIAMIPQDPLLFHRSLLENIRYGRLEATDAEVIAASKKAHCHEFIEVMPEGYNTLVGERGLKLSGGQRQRIAIARAFLKNAPILILDEATSALDSITEKKIRESLEYLMLGRTTIVIAHRLATLSDMDSILVFMGGQVVEEGTHAALLKQGGQYAKLWEMQTGGFLAEAIEGEEEEEESEFDIA